MPLQTGTLVTCACPSGTYEAAFSGKQECVPQCAHSTYILTLNGAGQIVCTCPDGTIDGLWLGQKWCLPACPTSQHLIAMNGQSVSQTVSQSVCQSVCQSASHSRSMFVCSLFRTTASLADTRSVFTFNQILKYFREILRIRFEADLDFQNKNS